MKLICEVIKSKSVLSFYGGDERRLAERQDILGGMLMWEADHLKETCRTLAAFLFPLYRKFFLQCISVEQILHMI